MFTIQAALKFLNEFAGESVTRKPTKDELEELLDAITAGGVVRLWLKQLEQPLVPFTMYEDFVALAREMQSAPFDLRRNLRALLEALPKKNLYVYRFMRLPYVPLISPVIRVQYDDGMSSLPSERRQRVLVQERDGRGKARTPLRRIHPTPPEEFPSIRQLERRRRCRLPSRGRDDHQRGLLHRRERGPSPRRQSTVDQTQSESVTSYSGPYPLHGVCTISTAPSCRQCACPARASSRASGCQGAAGRRRSASPPPGPEPPPPRP